MNTILLVLSAIALVFYVVGAVSLITETKVSPFYEYFVEKQGWLITAFGAVNALLITFAASTGVFTSVFQHVLFLVYIVLVLGGEVAMRINQFVKREN